MRPFLKVWGAHSKDEGAGVPLFTETTPWKLNKRLYKGYCRLKKGHISFDVGLEEDPLP